MQIESPKLLWQKMIVIWNLWELRVMVLVSLSLQVILILFGSRRKYTPGSKVRYNVLLRFLVWSAYLSADWVATAALGNFIHGPDDDGPINCECKLSSSRPPVNKDALQVIWAPILLLHLGGPDTITAYALEDNDLWLRHLLGLIIQVTLAAYILVKSWSTITVPIICVPLFVSGIVKYGERTHALRSASTNNFQTSLSPRNDPLRIKLKPYFIQYVELPNDKNDDFNALIAGRVRQRIVENYNIPHEAKLLHEAYFTFLMLADLFASTILTEDEVIGMLLMASTLSAKDMIRVVETELGFMYDILFTKASILYSKLGIFFRLGYLCCSISALGIFWFGSGNENYQYPKEDMIVSYILLVGAVGTDVYFFLLLISSDWTMLWLTKQKKLPLAHYIYQFLSRWSNKQKWSRSMGQHSLIKLCLEEGDSRWNQCLGIDVILRKYLHKTWEDVDDDFLEWIFNHLFEKRKKLDWSKQFPQKCFIRIHDQFSWTVDTAGFDQTLLAWHIATELCHQHNLENQVQCSGHAENNRKASRALSNYMLYLLVECPLMLPRGMGDLTFKLTSDVLKKNIGQESSVSSARITLLRKGSERKMVRMEESVMFDPVDDGCLIAKELLDKHGGCLWDIVSQVWVEMLTYAACQCDWRQHAQQLMRGGELLTHVCVFMAHIGMNEQCMFHVRRFTPA